MVELPSKSCLLICSDLFFQMSAYISIQFKSCCYQEDSIFSASGGWWLIFSQFILTLSLVFSQFNLTLSLVSLNLF